MDRLTIRQTSPEGAAFLALELTDELEVVNVGKLSDVVVDAFERGERHLQLDFTHITRCDSGSLCTILGIRHAASHFGGSLAIIAVSPAFRETLQQTGLRTLLPVTPR
ncbi:STAS domain-containing protein [Streptomyces sp. NPDC094438]|uniref:STAS domain-containing protein n=1 Tax=Streptomyces sp. NPDC094438 TaxID=3366061 RepID=UPI0038170E9D